MTSYKVKSDVLKWLREDSHVDPITAAKKIAIQPTEYLSYEKTDTEIAISKIRALATLFKRSILLFFLAAVPKSEGIPTDYRATKNHNAKEISQDLSVAIRRAKHIQELISEFDPIVPLSNELRTVSIKIQNNIDSAALSLHDIIGIDTSDQIKWYSDNYKALKTWKEAVEKLGIYVSEMTLPRNEVRAFSIYEKTNPVIVLSTKDTAAGRIFSLFHELGHIILRKTGICDLKSENQLTYEKKRIEQLCNVFASHFLVPPAFFSQDSKVQGFLAIEGVTTTSLQRIANRYKVSREVILMRLLESEQINERVYRILLNECAHEFAMMEKKKKSGFGDYIESTIKEMGVSFTERVIDEYKNERITYKAAADYLQTTINHLPEIEAKLDS